MTVKTIVDHRTSESRVILSEAVRAYNEALKTNPKTCIYLMYYGNAPHQLDSSETMGHVKIARTALKEVRDALVGAGVSRGRVAIVGVVVPKPERMREIDIVVSPVPLPVVVWTEGGLQTGDGQPGPNLKGTLNAEADAEGLITTEVELEYKLGKKFKTYLTYKQTADGFKEVSGKLKLLEQELSQYKFLGPLRHCKVTVKGGLVYDHEKQKIKAKVTAELSREVKIPGIGEVTIKFSFDVDHGGGVTPNLGLEIPLPGPLR
ncbi:MAG: hypothetical protein JNL98_03160 [Bryobacterales bacterium]|nr:hypothetical protein [Bryobacterales bacterium]